MNKRRSTAALLASLAFAWTPVAVAQDRSPVSDEDQAIFETRYRAQLTGTDRTPTPADDRLLAQDMLDFGQSLTELEDLGLQCLIYAETITLAAAAEDLGLMQQALTLLQASWAEQDLISDEQLMQLASRAYRGVDRRDRPTQGQHYIALLQTLADNHVQHDELEQAIGIYRLASTIAKGIDSDELDAITQTLDELSRANSMAKRIKMLERSVQSNPQNASAARELVELLIVRNDDIQTAGQYVASTRDEELIELVGYCVDGIDQANAPAALRVAGWYTALAEDQSEPESEDEIDQRRRLLAHARTWYASFLNQYTRDDGLAQHVHDLDQTLAEQIKVLEAALEEPEEVDGDEDVDDEVDES